MPNQAPTTHDAARLAWDGDQAFARGQLERAEQLYREASEAFAARESRKGEAAALGGLGATLAARGRREEALAVWERALDMHRALSDRRATGVVLAQIGALKLDQGEREAAARDLLDALELLEAEGESRRALETRLSLASLHHEAGRLAEAQALAEEGARVARAILDPRAEGIALSGLAAVLAERLARLELPAHPHARTVVQLHERAIQLHADARQPLEEAHARAGLAAFHLERRGYGAAVAQLGAARDRLVEAGDRGGEAWCLALLAVAEAAGGRLEVARRLLAQAAPPLASDPPREAALSVLVAAVGLAAGRDRPPSELVEADRAARQRVAERLAALGDPPPSAVRVALRVAAALLGRDAFAEPPRAALGG